MDGQRAKRGTRQLAASLNEHQDCYAMSYTTWCNKNGLGYFSPFWEARNNESVSQGFDYTLFLALSLTQSKVMTKLLALIVPSSSLDHVVVRSVNSCGASCNMIQAADWSRTSPLTSAAGDFNPGRYPSQLWIGRLIRWNGAISLCKTPAVNIIRNGVDTEVQLRGRFCSLPLQFPTSLHL